MNENKIHLLLVEDDEVDREAISRLLQDRYIIHQAPTGQVALHLLEEMKPNCVLLDYRLPDVDGSQLIPRFAAAFIPVIVTTGEESPEVIVDAMRLGAQDYLVKGAFSKTGLEHAITNAIEKVALQHSIVSQQQQLRAQAAELRASNQQVRRLASALTLSEQRERRRISQILHDHVQQMLHGIHMRAHLIELDAPPETRAPIEDHLQTILQLTDEALQATRTLTVELSPPVLQRRGLIAAFQWLTEQMEKVHNIEVTLHIQTEEQLANQEISVLIFQFARELLFNVVKHAGVACARLTLDDVNDQLLVIIEDDGRGFDAAQIRPEPNGGFGLNSIHERLTLFGGRLDIESAPGLGTRAMICIPKKLFLDGEMHSDFASVFIDRPINRHINVE